MDFDLLKTFAKTVTRNKIKNIEVLGEPNSKNKTEVFYEFLISDRFENERDAVRYFFKTYNIKHPPYLKLKSKLVHQLSNTSIFTDVNQPVFNERAKAYYTAYKDFSIATVLMARNADKVAIHMFQLILEQAVKYEFTDLAADVSRMLRCEYARIYGDIEKTLHYSDMHRKFEEKRRYDMQALDYHETLTAYYINKRAPNYDIYKLASSFFDELYPLADQVDTSFFYRCTYQIGIMKFNLINDTTSAIALCDEALRILTSKKNTNRSTLAYLMIQKIALTTQLRRYDDENINRMVDYCLDFIEIGSFTWFRMYEVYFYYRNSCSNYEESLKIYDLVKKNDGFSSLEGSFYDNWLLLGGYLHLLSRLGVLDQTHVEETVGKFRYSKLHNEIEVLKNDKEGMNIPLILLPVLYELAQEPSKRTKEIPVDALDKYRQRWLANDMNKRSNCFFKMVIALAKNDYLSPAVQKKINREMEILKNETPEIAGQNFAIEIIPYENLWEMLIAKAYPKQAANHNLNIPASSKSTSNSIRSTR